MRLHELLNQYLKNLNATGKDLAEASGLSQATVSRYCSGEREPVSGSTQVEKLADGILYLIRHSEMNGPLNGSLPGAKEDSANGSAFPSRKDILNALNEAVQDEYIIDYEAFIANLSFLIENTDMHISELARGIYTDPSYISKILSGNRRPRNPHDFIREVSAYIAHRFSRSDDIELLSRLLGADAEDLRTENDIRAALITWLGSNTKVPTDDAIPRFLNRMDNFDLHAFQRSIHYDRIRIPPAMPHMPTRKEYTGIKRMMESEIDFMRTTVLSKSRRSVILYSDMPLEEMAADPEFPKKYLIGMALMLKKGLHLNFIHDVNRPFREMMMGLENYLPMYMTGQISPYYLPQSQSRVFCHLLKVSGSAALEGHAISGKQGAGRYTLYRSREDIAHYRQRAEDLLEKAIPLMEIFREDNAADYRAILNKVWQADAVSGERRIVCSNLPVYLFAKDQLKSVAKTIQAAKENSGPEDANAIWQDLRTFHDKMRSALIAMLTDHRVCIVLPDLTKEQFLATPVSPALADLFAGPCTPLNYASYRRCLDEAKSLASQYKNLTLEWNPAPLFSSINYSIFGDEMVIVSKEKSPVIHFVIHHKKMIRAFQNLMPAG